MKKKKGQSLRATYQRARWNDDAHQYIYSVRVFGLFVTKRQGDYLGYYKNST